MEDGWAFHGVDPERWQHTQDLFSRIIGANLRLYTTDGRLLNPATQITANCSDFYAAPSSGDLPVVCDCLQQTLQKTFDGNQKSFQCLHTLHYFTAKIQTDNQAGFGVVVVGPVLIGRRETTSFYHDLCDRRNIDAENFCDRIREIRVFSQYGMQVVLDFLCEMIQYTLHLAEQRKKLIRMIEGLPDEPRKTEALFSALKREHVADYLLDIACRLMQSDSGSVLLLDHDTGKFELKTSRGLRTEVVRKSKILAEHSVAGWVAERKQSILIDQDLQDEHLRNRLKRPEIKSSMVIPMMDRNEMLGLFSVNTVSDNHRFNRDHLLLLNQLGQLAGAALSHAQPD